MLQQFVHIICWKLDISYLLIIWSAMRFQCAGLSPNQDPLSAVVSLPAPRQSFL